MSKHTKPPLAWGGFGKNRRAVLSVLILQLSEGRPWVKRNQVFVLSGLEKGLSFDLAVDWLIQHGWVMEKVFDGEPNLSLHVRAVNEFSLAIPSVEAQPGGRHRH